MKLWFYNNFSRLINKAAQAVDFNKGQPRLRNNEGLYKYFPQHLQYVSTG